MAENTGKRKPMFRANYKTSHLVAYRLKKTPFFPDFEHFSARIQKFARKVRENCEKFQPAKAKNERKK